MQFLSHATTSVEIPYCCKVGLLLTYVRVSIKPKGGRLESQLGFVKCSESQ